jgi:hypothetical protein
MFTPVKSPPEAAFQTKAVPKHRNKVHARGFPILATGQKYSSLRYESGSQEYCRCERKPTMSVKLVWIEQQRFLGFGCSECGWRFKPSGAPTGTSFDEMMRNFVLQRDQEFTLHIRADHPPRAKSTYV